MALPGPGFAQTRTTSDKVVLPFYLYASLSLIAASVLLFISTPSFQTAHFNPGVLSVTHVMALGWGSMMILGASHQLVPVMIEGKLFSNFLGHVSFVLAAFGIIFLVTGFYRFEFTVLTKTGGILVLSAFVVYFINLLTSIIISKSDSLHALFVLTATVWVVSTMTLGVLLIFNFTDHVLANGSVYYLTLHAHMGIVGWFLMTIMGVGTRLIPMFMISKYTSAKRMWWMYGLVNGALLMFVFSYILKPSVIIYNISIVMVIIAIIIFMQYCYLAWKSRIRKKVDPQVKISIFSSVVMLVPAIIILIVLTLSQLSVYYERLILIYGFCIFFGWISDIIFGMTFKTLPFILWRKKFQKKAGKGSTPNPKDLFSQQIFRWMLGTYFTGFILFVAGIIFSGGVFFKAGAALLVVVSLLFNWNVINMLRFKKE